ncbi:diaminobutyrate acetyltransferase [Thermocrispum municipale]|jgi:L-2,4-diaminobutyric acid acetyltransferase|uniref:diaminobutyrate acetyltransferase n=1 Tax=Thermocrispum municipale TaxID=37926 RepID=UPI00040F6BB2|nr:diaminobutyrate acetyltransferase [Thermocrispum municipale]
MSGNSNAPADGGTSAAGELVIDNLRKSDGAALWRMARDSGKLDLNSSYAYLLWAVDFADTSVIARLDGEPVGFVIGYRKQRAPDTAVVWQVAVDARARGRGVAGKLLDRMYTPLVRDGVRYLETTITPDNEASIALFAAFAKRWGAEMERSPLFSADDFPDEHEPEDLYRIGPLRIRR